MRHTILPVSNLVLLVTSTAHNVGTVFLLVIQVIILAFKNEIPTYSLVQLPHTMTVSSKAKSWATGQWFELCSGHRINTFELLWLYVISEMEGFLLGFDLLSNYRFFSNFTWMWKPSRKLFKGWIWKVWPQKDMWKLKIRADCKIKFVNWIGTEHWKKKTSKHVKTNSILKKKKKMKCCHLILLTT